MSSPSTLSPCSRAQLFCVRAKRGKGGTRASATTNRTTRRGSPKSERRRRGHRDDDGRRLGRSAPPRGHAARDDAARRGAALAIASGRGPGAPALKQTEALDVARGHLDDRRMEGGEAHLDEADVLGVLAEALPAYVQVVLANDTPLVRANAAEEGEREGRERQRRASRWRVEKTGKP